ncbi:hypothetical protein [Photobacterium iliopiscarium]|uniref:DUF3144 domain-containing protein n=1 Tax=Photobacterium iliopiscarium TaxID=56192 RepID=A0ABX5GMR5_9GAMM|nr:hypothetical protein [Photobacterium iliopiscarium]PSW92296.1 hypothetical protein C9J52_18900 [Photobacterium iliopiscarium]
MKGPMSDSIENKKIMKALKIMQSHALLQSRVASNNDDSITSHYFRGAANELFLLADSIKNKTLDELIEKKEKSYQYLIENDALNNPIKKF